MFHVSVETVDDDADFSVPVDIFAIGFEEIVDLNAGNIVSARLVVFLTAVCDRCLPCSISPPPFHLAASVSWRWS